ncbi:hypothetical protein, partial [Shewanella indica]|uniref:hypothetical protein n=1 Tax=Shewanella indica TaxID=768528 RepID=UPI00300626E0
CSHRSVIFNVTQNFEHPLDEGIKLIKGVDSVFIYRDFINKLTLREQIELTPSVTDSFSRINTIEPFRIITWQYHNYSPSKNNI